MNEYDLFDAFGGIDDELLNRSEYRAVRKFPIRKALIAAAAVMLLAVTVVAAPKLRELLFGSEIELYHKGIMYAENDLCFSVDAAYEVDMTLPCAENAPMSIEEYYLPSYFEKNNWNCDSSFVDPNMEHIGARYLFSVPGKPQYWVIFEQSPFSLLEPRGRSQFLMNAGRTGIVIERAITIGDVEGTMYVVEPSEPDGEPGQKNLVWSDGEYAYLMECGWAVSDEMIAMIAESLASVEDITPYATEPADAWSEVPRLPIETFYTLETIPGDFHLTERYWDINLARQHWENSEGESITLFQDCVVSEFNGGPMLSIDMTMAEVLTSLDSYEYEAVNENGLFHHIVYQHGDTYAMWQTEEYVFLLRFNGQRLTPDEMMVHIRNVQPMPDFTDHLTE